MSLRKPLPVLWTAATCAWLLACDQRTETAPQAEKAAPSAPGTSVRGLKKLAMEDPGGSGRIDQKIRKLQNTLKKQPKKFDAWIMLGRTWVQKARQATEPAFYHNANACASAAMELKPEHPLALNLQGMVLMNDHRFAEAEALMRAVLAKDSDDIMALGTLSDALLELGRFDEALKATQKMVELKPSLPSYARASYLAWLKGDFESAKEAVRHAIDAGGSPRDREPLAWVLVEASKLFWHQGDYEGAEAGLQQSLAVFPDYPPALVWMARSKLARGLYAEAASLAKRSYEQAALAETARVWGDAAKAAGNVKEASIAYGKLERLGRQGEYRVLAAYYADVQESPAKIDEAIALARKELSGRKDLYTQDALAWALYRKGDVKGAQEAIEAATALGTQDAQLLFHKGAILIAAGQTAPGRALIQKALKLNPNFHPEASVEAQALLK